MTCQQVQKLLPDYSVERLSVRQQEAITQHLAVCASCAREWAALQGSLALLERLDRPEPKSELWRQIEARLTSERPRPWRITWRWEQLNRPWLRVPALVSAVVAGALAMVLLLRPSPPPGPTGFSMPTARRENSYVQQYARSASYEPLADRAALGAIAFLARPGK